MTLVRDVESGFGGLRYAAAAYLFQLNTIQFSDFECCFIRGVEMARDSLCLCSSSVSSFFVSLTWKHPAM
jgi:hypothetical protein